jgi:hypothetical protein
LWYFHVCIYVYVLEQQLVHLLYFSSFYLSLFLMMVSASLRIVYSFLCRENNHIPLFSFLLLSYSSHMWHPFSVSCFS